MTGRPASKIGQRARAIAAVAGLLAMTLSLNTAAAEVYCTAEGDAVSNIADCNTVLARSDLTTLERANAFNNRAVNHIELGDLEAAIKDLERAIELEPTEPSYYSNAAHVMEIQGNLDAAFTFMQLALRHEDHPELRDFIRQDLDRLQGLVD